MSKAGCNFFLSQSMCVCEGGDLGGGGQKVHKSVQNSGHKYVFLTILVIEFFNP